MHRIDTPTNVSVLPTPGTGAGQGYFSNGNPGSGLPATVVDADWFNDTQEELISILVAAGITPNKTVHNQVLTALFQLIAGGYSNSTRIRLMGPLSLYVSASGSDTTGTGTSAAPWATINNALSVLQNYYDLGGQVVTINISGTVAPCNIQGLLLGQVSGQQLVLTGVGGTSPTIAAPTSTSLTPAITATGNAQVTVQNLTLTAASSNHGIYCTQRSTVFIGAGMVYGSCGGAHIAAANGGQIFISSNYTIAGNAQSHYSVFYGGTITIYGGTTLTITLSGTRAFSVAFASASDLSQIYISSSSAAFSGSATGSRYSVQSNSIMDTSGSGASYLPGSTAGTTATNGLYL